MKSAVFWLVLLGSICAWAGGPTVFSAGDIAVLQENADSTYNVVCMNGNRETITALDLKLGNVCPHLESSEPTDILSMQRREDGNFDVYCRDNTRAVATPAQVMAGEACKATLPSVVLENGVYRVKSGYTNFCDQKVTTHYEGTVLKGLLLEYINDGCDARDDMTCEGKTCKGISNPDRVLEILGPKAFHYTSAGNAADFAKVE